MRMERDAKDAQRLARAIASCPLSEGPVLDPEDATSIAQLQSGNLTLFARGVLAIGMRAANGDEKAMRVFMDLTGYQSEKETNVKLVVPTYIDDITIDVTPVEVPEEDTTFIEAPEEETLAIEPPTIRCIETGMEFSTIAEAARLADVPYGKFRTAVIKGKPVNGRHYERLA